MPSFILRLFLVVSVMVAGTADAAARDPAARGLDLFVHAPHDIPSAGSLPVQVRVFGFPTVSTLVPAPGAQVEAAWDPESLGDDASAAPAPVAGTCDEGGRVHLEVPVPAGSGKLKLLVAVHWQGHERVRTLEIERTRRHAIDLRTSDSKVVPGGNLSAWVFVRDRVTGAPVGGTAVDLLLKEGALARFERRLITDAAGMVSAEVPIPLVSDPEIHWQLSARTAMGRGEEAAAETTLGVREETPQAPALTVRWNSPSAERGASVSATLEVRDGAGQGIAQLPLRTWVGPRGTHAPKDDKAWQAASQEARTDADGRVTITARAPTTLSARGSSLTLVGKAVAEGQPLVAEATLPIVSPAPELTIKPEFGVLLPGQTQRLFLHASLDGKPVPATLALDGHGLKATVASNARGWAAVEWNVPAEVGAHVPDSAETDCAGQVATTVRVRWVAMGAGVSSMPRSPRSVNRCVPVDRDAVAAVRPERAMVTAGDALAVRIVGAKGSASVLAQGPDKGAWQSVWLADASRGGGLRLPDLAPGEWQLGAAGLSLPKNKTVLGTGVLVLPRLLPRLVARVDGAHAGPRGTMTVSATLDDGHGKPLTGSLGAVVFDKAGGTHPERLLALDTRRALAAAAGVKDEDVDAFLEGDPGFDIERWAALGAVGASIAPESDPVATVDAEIDRGFAQIVQSLEGALYESSSDPERLADVRVRSGTGFALNPEMLTLVTEAMSEPTLTPGGEPWRLGDLMAVDSQVRYDTVARRVTRLKLFRVLVKLRNHLFEDKLGPDEPALRDPNALLRRLVREEVVASGELLDPWGRGMAFVRWSGPRLPFLSMMPGHRLVSAGPDGRFATADDVVDPFQRVLASHTPYAKAVQEDRIVDAKWDMRVGDETVEAWTRVLEEMTGEKLGDEEDGYGSGGLGLGSGSGYGGGVGGLGGRRASQGLDPGSAHWLPPVRTDRDGHARLVVPLGDAETTWQVVLIAVPDRGSTAVTSVETSTALPVSVRLDSGASWLVGDELEVPIRLRNRTEHALSMTVHLAASGSVHLLDASAAKRTFSVAARSFLEVHARVRAATVGTAVLEASVVAGPHADRIRHEWPVKATGEVHTAERAAWVERDATLPLPEANQQVAAQGESRLVFERGIEPVLAAVVDSLAPDRLTGTRAYADALEVLARVRAWAIVRGGEQHGLAARARDLGQQIDAMVAAIPADDGPLGHRARRWGRLVDVDDRSGQGKPSKQSSTCPSDKHLSTSTLLDWMETAPRVVQGAEGACWSGLRAVASNRLAGEEDASMVARGVLVFADQPDQSALVAALARRLSAMVPVRGDGTLVLPDSMVASRADRCIVLAALARYGQWSARDHRPTLWARLLTERDGLGGYGSTEATRRVVRVLLAGESASPSSSTVRYTELSAQGKAVHQGQLELAANQSMAVALSSATARVRIEASAPGVLVRARRPLFRSFFQPGVPAGEPLHVDLALPKVATAGGFADVQITLAQDTGRRVPVLVRVPLPPGARLAAKSEGLSQVQGAIYLRTSLESDALPRVLSVPLRFGMAGTVTMPEVTARITDDDLPIARAPARPLEIRCVPGP